MAKRSTKAQTERRRAKKAGTRKRPRRLEVGYEITWGGQTFVVTKEEKPGPGERRYRVRVSTDDSPQDEERTCWLAHRTANPEDSRFATIAEALRSVHAARRFRLLPALVAHFTGERGEFLVLDRLFGEKLADRWGELADPHERSLLFEQLFLMLSKLHRAGFVVASLRPKSLVSGEEGQVQLVDLSTLTRGGEVSAGLEANAYSPPELATDQPVDERTDIFAAGALFASAYLQRRFRRGTDLTQLVERETVLEPVVTQMLRGSLVERDIRFLSIDEMRILLYQLKNEQAGFPRPTAAMSSTVGVSRYRYINEDSAGFQELGVQYQSRPQFVGFYCVADGMGGHELGERASQLAVLGALQAFRYLTQEIPFERLRDGAPAFALAIGRSASEVVSNGALQFPGGSRMGTTFTGVLVLNDELSVAHVGDSRALLIRDDTVTPLTLDHSLVASLVRVGQMTEEEAAQSEERNVLVRCIDARMPMDESGFDGLRAVGIEDGRLKILRGDLVILLSDGVWGALSDEEIVRVATNGSRPQTISDDIIRAALAAGSDDNATAMVISWV